MKMTLEKRSGKIWKKDWLERPSVYTKEDGENNELDKLKKGITKHRDYIFTVLTNPAVPYPVGYERVAGMGKN